MRFMHRFIDLETDPAGFGDPGGDPAAYTAIEDPGAAPPAQQSPEATPEYVSRAELEQALAERDAALAYQQFDPALAADPYAQQQQPAPPQLDPFDDSYGQNLVELMRQVVREETGQMRQMVEPIAQNYQDQQAQQWAEETLSQLGVPDDQIWRDAALAASAGYERDPWGRPVAPQHAVRQGYETLRALVQAERSKWEAEQQQAAQQQQQQLKAVAAAPNLPAGAGGAEGQPQPVNARDAVRAAFERVTAGNAGTAA